MKLQTITNKLNEALAGELLLYEDMLPYLDKAIDEINIALNAKYPVFSELDEPVAEYKAYKAYTLLIAKEKPKEAAKTPYGKFLKAKEKDPFVELKDYITITPIQDYDLFPDKYIRQVVIPYAAFKYFNMDEEGNNGAPQYEADYREGIFYMLRDYSEKVDPWWVDDNQGWIIYAEKGMEINEDNWKL